MTTTARRRLADLTRDLVLPVVAAPMFLVSGPDMVIASCRAGIVGSFPAPNARTLAELDRWLDQIAAAVDGAPWAVNLVAHRTYDRLDTELARLAAAAPPLVVTALGSPRRAVDAVHGWGGLVLADVSTVDQSERALAAGVDGLVLVCAGSGGHTGRYSPLALVPEVRRRFDGPIIAGGAVGTGGAVLAMRALGADLAYVGTRFLAVEETLIAGDYRRLVVEAGIDDIETSDTVTGVPANWLRRSLERHRSSQPSPRGRPAIDFSGDISADRKAWRDVWSAGHGVGSVTAVEPLAAAVGALSREHEVARAALGGREMQTVAEDVA